MEGRGAQTVFAMELSSSSRALLAVPGLSFRAKALGLGVLAASLPFWVSAALVTQPRFFTLHWAAPALVIAAGCVSVLSLLALRTLLVAVSFVAEGVRANAALASAEAKGKPKDEMLGAMRDVDAVAARLESVRHRLANRHPVTGVSTREPMMAAITRDVARENCPPTLLGVLRLAQFERLIAVDKAGAEKALQAFATRLVDCVGARRPYAQIDRDSFAVWFCDTDGPKAGREALQTLAAQLAQPLGQGDLHIIPDVRVGAAIYPDDGLDGPTLLSRAVAAVGKAGRAAGDRLAYFSDESSVDAEARHAMEQALRQAIFRKELALFYQPVIDLTASRVVGAEALLRWRHPELGAIPPAKFLPVMEQSGLIGEVGRWVLEQACRDARGFESLGLPGFKVGVNLSQRQFRDPELSTMIADVLRRSELKPARLELELTEASLMRDPSHTRKTLETFASIGVAVAIDDFGAGASSLANFQSLAFSKLKIDRKFVTDVANRHDSQAVCAALIELGRRLDIAVLAEGVETPEEVEALRLLGCSLFQGFFFARPLPADKFVAKISDPQWLSLLSRPTRLPPVIEDQRLAG
jgi:EAL domain-containing protein (putative c-di-GMP-specific phosphodiesterase class I)/GGDEF domain-containing protein